MRDDILVTMAGPAMNLVLAVVLVALARVGVILIRVPSHGGFVLQWRS